MKKPVQVLLGIAAPKRTAADKKYPSDSPEYKRAWVEKNRVMVSQKRRDYRKANKERIAAEHRAHYLKNREKILAKVGARRERKLSEIRAKEREYRKNNVEKLAHRRIELLYGVPRGFLDEMLSAQEWCCASCGVAIGKMAAPNRRKAHIDHDHQTGVVRGLLCSGCNTGIGLLGDDPEKIRDAALYLESCRG